ncbi:MAG: low molecular weight phosphotyrosine protein phosphatase [Gloeomargaritaceae cyanobacterium C42_A2020_066]|nr:low molecular weight phosphotyrosine protein phosphatase [Gloeomargaritaceae cyanobacterium C42_A2020_066]
MVRKLLFVCMGNICRSPAAEGVMSHLLARHPLGETLVCDSAGTIGYHTGSPPDSRMQVAAQARGIRLQSRARQFHPRDFEAFDLILVMDQENYRDVIALDPHNRHRHKVRMMCEFCTQRSDREVPDPYYGGAAGFEYVLDLLEDACQGLLRHLEQETSRR